jgi:hypothetical protein
MTNPRRTTKSRPSSSGSAGSAGGNGGTVGSAVPSSFESGVPNIPLSASAILTRDFEGVGGWRLPGGQGAAADALDEQAWESLNSRLKLPDHHQQQQQRHHNRSRSGGPILVGNLAAYGLSADSTNRSGSASPEGLRVKTNPTPNSSRSRTPTRTTSRLGGLTSMDQDGYFPSAATVLKRN